MAIPNTPKSILFPARAGVIRSCIRISLVNVAVPRASGGDPLKKMSRLYLVHCSPRERG